MGCPRSDASSICPISCTRMPRWSAFLPGIGVAFTCKHRIHMRVSSARRVAQVLVTL